MPTLSLFADAQGFLIDGVFHPRELSISDGKNFLNYEFDVSVPVKSKDIPSIAYNRSNVHGLTQKSDKWKSTIPSTAFEEVIKGIFDRFDMKRTKIATNNNQFADALRKLDLPVVDIFIPSNVPLESSCPLHDFSSAKCSLAKVKRLYKFLQN